MHDNDVQQQYSQLALMNRLCCCCCCCCCFGLRCRRLVLEWNAYIARTNSLRRVFVSVKGFYYQVVGWLWG
jgi:hypothetical protein